MRSAAELVAELEGYCKWLGGQFYVPGLDRDDVQQEARLAVLKAIDDWKPELSPWYVFATLAARRHVITLIVTARREKRGLGVRPVSLDVPLDPGDEEPLYAMVVGHVSAAREALARLELHEIAEGANLSALEHRALVGVGVGMSYDELGGPFKQTDNAVQRARRKLAA